MKKAQDESTIATETPQHASLSNTKSMYFYTGISFQLRTNEDSLLPRTSQTGKLVNFSCIYLTSYNNNSTVLLDMPHNSSTQHPCFPAPAAVGVRSAVVPAPGLD
mmetsp:Transcript_5319/g.11753  ORF Transcript_5319/g.11753 Transcript_5319/m.11753 type:complete len:105 (-) Transcript_5319:212-526(-)